LPAALTEADRDLAGLLLYYADKKAWREGREAEVLRRALRRVRIWWWSLETVYAVMVTSAAISLLFPDTSALGDRLPVLLVLLLVTAVAAFVFRRGTQRTRALEAELHNLGSAVPSQKPLALVAAVVFVLLIVF
jgi:hypothetical protein